MLNSKQQILANVSPNKGLAEISPFKTTPLYSLSKSKNNKSIVIFVHNVQDGVGDFEHAVSFAEELSTFKSQGYKIVAIVETEKVKVSEADSELQKEHSKLINNRAESVKNRLLQLHSLFDEIHLIEHIDGNRNIVDLNKLARSGTQHQRAHEHIQDENHRISEAVKNCSIGIIAGYYTSAQKELPASTPCLNLQQYGSYQSLMGLSSSLLGMKLYPEKEESNPAQRLVNIGKNDPAFVQYLIGKVSYNEHDAKQYLETHYFVPGYIQTFNASTTFILSQIEKQAQTQNGIEKRFDFIIPAGAIDEKLIRSVIEPALAEHGIKPDEIQFMDATTLKKESGTMQADNSKYKVRILSPFVTSRDDYESLYFLTQDGTGCSGDNTISVSFSAQSLPYFQFKPNEFVIGKFYTQHLIPLLTIVINDSTDPAVIEGLENLKCYFEHLTTFSKFQGQSLFEPMYFAEPDSKYRMVNSKQEWEKIVKEQYSDRAQEIIDWCKETGRLSNADNIMAGWLHFQKVLFQNHNVRNHLNDLVQLKLNQSKNITTLQNTNRAQKLFQNKIISADQFNADELSKLIATDHIVTALCTSELTPTHVINMNEIDLVKFRDKLSVAEEFKVNHSRLARSGRVKRFQIP